MDLVVIARTVRTRGLRGEIVAEILTDFPERFEGLEEVVGVDAEGNERELVIESHWFQKGRVILKFRGISSIEAAEDLLHLDICVPESEAVDLKGEEYYDWQLTECEVVDTNGTKLGKVREIMRTGANENLVVAGSKKDYLIPFVKAICLDVDIDKKMIRVEIPEGLLDF